jgi:two-component system, NarL family, sensor histidine kinase UhpB
VSLYWKVVVVNGAVFFAGTLALVVSPASVSSRAVVSEVVVLTMGLAAMLLTNALLLRASLGSVDRVVREMSSVDLLEPGHRLSDSGSGPGATLVRSYNQMLDRLEAERGASDAKALAAQESERHRIAQELHDQVGQSLTVVLLGLKQLEHRAPADLVSELELVRESARAGLDDVRRVARELRPGVLEDLGLHSALTALATEVSTATGAPVRRTFAPGLPELSPEVELVVYRVAQEALTNIARHAAADHVELSLTRSGGQVVLEVTDDGVGGPELVPGAGIRGMRERAALVGGRFTISHRAPRGTRVRLEVPVPDGH